MWVRWPDIRCVSVLESHLNIALIGCKKKSRSKLEVREKILLELVDTPSGILKLELVEHAA